MDYCRYYAPNAIVFITQVVDGRASIFAEPIHVALLRSILHTTQAKKPFHMLGYVFMPDHFHLLIKPSPGVTHSQIMHSLKLNFTLAYKKSCGIVGPLRFWQQRYWDHVVRDERDFQRHLDYIHYNPVKHGYAARPEEWMDSSYVFWRQRGAYPQQWGWRLPETLQDVQQEYAE
jgi:putative transposase